MLASVPAAARWLGLSGLIPFYAPPIAIFTLPLFTTDPSAIVGYGVVLVGVQLAYAAVIISFLGAVHWGLVLSETIAVGGAFTTTSGWAGAPARLIWSVTPSLGALAALLVFQVTLNGSLGLVMMAGWLVACFVYDRWAVAKRFAPPWYLELRKVLTAAALVSLALTVAAAAAVG